MIIIYLNIWVCSKHYCFIMLLRMMILYGELDGEDENKQLYIHLPILFNLNLLFTYYLMLTLILLLVVVMVILNQSRRGYV
jgi:hypothetical protein